jgi:hypothetical protein
MGYTLSQVIDAVKAKGYKIDKRPFALNIVGIRTDNPVSQDRFDDYIAFWYYNNGGIPVGRVAPATTDPSTYWLKNPLNQSGAAILKSGYYKNSHHIGLHRGSYEALVQQNPVTVIRDNDRDGYTNLLDKTETGIYGINIHKATPSPNDPSLIGKNSAGCQVFQNVNDFNDMMALAKKSSNLYGNNFSYILLDERDTKKKLATVSVLVITGMLMVSTYIYFFTGKK